MNPFKRIPIESLIPPSITCAVLYPIHEQTNSVLLLDNLSSGLSSYSFKDTSADQIIKEKVILDFRNHTNIIVTEANTLCCEIMQRISDDDVEWKFILILRNFIIPTGAEIMPTNLRWYHKNTLPWSRMQCPAEREFLKEFMKATP